MNWKRALLAVPPLLGLLCIWNISHRQERLLVGRWQTGQTNLGSDSVLTDTISFHGDGTFEKYGTHVLNMDADRAWPGGSVRQPSYGGYRSLGHWYFADKNHLVMIVESEQCGGKPMQPPGRCGNPLADEDSVAAPDAAGGEISFDINGDTAHVDGTLGPGGPTWTRIVG